MKSLIKCSLISTVVTLLPMALAASDELPESTKDGLVLQKNSKVAALYLKPGASLEAYDRIYLVDAYVAFKKDWQKDYNRQRAGLEGRISDADMDRIKKDVASEFKRVFTEALEQGGYQIATEAAPDVMILRPAIINLDIAAPDTSTPGMRAIIVRSAGSLSLYAELYDSVTSDKFAEVLDAQEDLQGGFAHTANRITNKAALDRVLNHWAGLLVKALDEAHGRNS